MTPTAQPRYDRNPVMFGDKPMLFLLLLALSPLIVGALALVAWYLGTLAHQVTVENGKVRYRNGLLSKRVKEVSIANIRAVEVDQTPLQRLTKVGRIRIFTAGDLPEIAVRGLPHPYEIRDLVNAARAVPAG